MIEEKHLGQLWDSLAFTKLFRTFRLAIGPSKLLIALGVVASVYLIGGVMDLVTESVAVTETVLSEEQLEVVTELEVYIEAPEEVDQFKRQNGSDARTQGVFATLSDFISDRFNDAFVPLLRLDTSNIFANVVNVFVQIGLTGKAFVWAIRYHLLYSLVFFAFSLIAFCIAGGAICRCAALEFARGEKPGIFEALRFSFGKFRSLLAIPAIPAMVMTFLGLPIFLLGLVANIPAAGPVIMALGLPLALLIGLIFTAALTGSLFGFNLMFPTVAYQSSDSFDAISRSFMYVLTQPVWMITYSFIAMVYGTLSYLVVRFFSYLLLSITYNVVSLGVFADGPEGDKLARIWPEPAFTNLLGGHAAVPATTTESVSAFFVNLTLLLVVGLIAAFVVSFYFCANTIIYSLLRHKVDGCAEDDVYVELMDKSSAG